MKRNLFEFTDGSIIDLDEIVSLTPFLSREFAEGLVELGQTIAFGLPGMESVEGAVVYRYKFGDPATMLCTQADFERLRTVYLETGED